MSHVTAELREGTVATIHARQFTWSADEPLAAGGTDSGPTPYEILLGSLAACITITLRLYANHKGIELTGVDVRLEFDRVHADDCSDCDEARRRIHRAHSIACHPSRIFRRRAKKTTLTGSATLSGAQDARERCAHQRCR